MVALPRLVVASVAVVAVVLPSSAQEVDSATTLARYRAALAVAPDHAGFLLAAAALSAETGETSSALDLLERAVATGADIDIQGDKRFSALVGSPRFAALLADAASGREGESRASATFHLSECDLVPEGIAFDPVDSTLFIGSIAKRKIVAVGLDGRRCDFTGAGHDLWQVLGMAVDARRRLLWMAMYEDQARGDSHQVSALVALALPGAQVVRRVEMDRAESHQFNDVALASDGTVYVTDTTAGTVYELGPAAKSFEPLLEPGTLKWANGIALDEAHGWLYVACFPHGVARLELASGRVAPVGRVPGVTLNGIDGLYLDGGALVAVQNSCGAPRLVRFMMEDGGSTVVAQEVLQHRDEVTVLPTTAVIAGADLYYVGDSLIDLLQPDGSLAESPRVAGPTVLRLPLRR